MTAREVGDHRIGCKHCAAEEQTTLREESYVEPCSKRVHYTKAGDTTMTRQGIGELISEALATFIILALGDSVACMYVLYDPSPYANAYWGVCIAWGLAVTLAIYVTGSVSGTHANPAVTLALAVYRGFPWRKVVPYCLAQVVGGF